MLQQPEPADYVIGTGDSHSVREVLEEAFGYLGLAWQDYVEVDRRYVRPSEVAHLQADATRARALLGWTPKITFQGLIKMMVDYDLEMARQEQTLRKAGHTVVRGAAYG
jgi:GDPmannose 4,6-dehydratase